MPYVYGIDDFPGSSLTISKMDLRRSSKEQPLIISDSKSALMGLQRYNIVMQVTQHPCMQ